jgi:hypothetical protein
MESVSRIQDVPGSNLGRDKLPAAFNYFYLPLQKNPVGKTVSSPIPGEFIFITTIKKQYTKSKMKTSE